MTFSFYWFTKPSFLRGFARAIDIRGTLSKEAVILSPDAADADRRAILSDFAIVADDSKRAQLQLELNGAAQ